MRRVLLIVPTSTYRASDFSAAAHRLGCEVVVATDESTPLVPGLRVPLDDPVAAAAAIVEQDEVSPLDGVVALDDAGVEPAALAAAKLGLVHNAADAVRATRDKSLMRARLAAAEVTQPEYRVVVAGAGPAAAAAAAADVGFPCVVKPVSLSASRGVIRADDAAAARLAAGRAWAIAGPGETLLVERFVPGREVAVEGLLRGGVLEVLAIFDKPDPLDGPYFEETIYVTPSRLPGAVQRAVAAATARAVDALGLTEGPVHAEARITPPGRVVVLEVASRSIGGLCARTLRFGLGVTIEELILRHALGLPARSSRREKAAAGVMMLPTPRAGKLVSVEGLEDARAVAGVTGLEITVPPGTHVRPTPEADRYLGFLFAGGETPGAVEAALRRAAALLRVRIE